MIIKKFPFPPVLGRTLALFLFGFGTSSLWSADSTGINSPSNSVSQYLEPHNLTGTICEISDPNAVLFRFRRTAANSGTAVYVLREYSLTNGTVAAREKVVYNGNKLVSYELDDLRSGIHGEAVVSASPKNPAQSKISFEFTRGSNRKTDSEAFHPNVLINDMVAPFLASHWSALTNGETLNVRLVAIARTETVGFNIRKESQTRLDGKPAIIIRMQPSSLLIAQFIDPLFFTMEAAEPHRILRYTGRTTPTISKRGKWVDLDALNLFDWHSAAATSPN